MEGLIKSQNEVEKEEREKDRIY